jgi:hypothetical protein
MERERNTEQVLILMTRELKDDLRQLARDTQADSIAALVRGLIRTAVQQQKEKKA